MSHPLIEAAAAPYVIPDAWRLITKFAYFVGLSAASGAAVVYIAALRPALREHSTDPADRAVMRRWSSIVLAFAGLILLVVLYPQLAGKAARFGDGMPYDQALTPSGLWTYLGMTPKPGEWISTGGIAFLQFGLLGVLSVLLVLLFIPRLRAALDPIAWAAAIGIPVLEMILLIPTNFAGQTVPGVVAHFITNIHPLAATTWVGGLGALAALALSRRRLSAGGGMIWARTWKRFSLVAEICVGLMIASGLFLSWGALGSFSQLWETPFGRVLLLKILLVAALLVIGGFNEFSLLPKITRLRAEGDERGLFSLVLHHFPRVVAIEATIGLAVLVVLPFLNGSGREEAGMPADPAPTGEIFAAVGIVFVFGIIAFISTLKVHAAINRSITDGSAVDSREAVPQA